MYYFPNVCKLFLVKALAVASLLLCKSRGPFATAVTWDGADLAVELDRIHIHVVHCHVARLHGGTDVSGLHTHHVLDIDDVRVFNLVFELAMHLAPRAPRTAARDNYVVEQSPPDIVSTPHGQTQTKGDRRSYHGHTCAYRHHNAEDVTQRQAIGLLQRPRHCTAHAGAAPEPIAASGCIFTFTQTSVPIHLGLLL